jgi:hypothetical protein
MLEVGMKRTTSSLKLNGSELKWDDLTSTEREVLISMLISKNDTEAIRLAPVAKTTFYALKRRLRPLKDTLSVQVSAKALEILQGNSIKAAETLSKLLDSNHIPTKRRVAEQILDRTVGSPKRQEQINAQITQIGFVGVTKEDLLSLTKPPEIVSN